MPKHRAPGPLAVFIDPPLARHHGHHFHLAAAYGDLLGDLGYEFRVFHACQHGLDARQNHHPYFAVPHHTLGFRDIRTSAELAQVDAYFTAEFEGIFQDQDPDVAVFGTIRFVNFAAAATVLVRTARRRGGRALFGVMEGADAPDCKDKSLVRSAFARAASILDRHAIEYRIVVESGRLRDFLIGCGFAAEKIKLYQYVAARRIYEPAPRPGPGPGVAVGYVGGTRAVRNPELMVDFICSGGYPASVHWRVQIDLNYVRKRMGEGPANALRALGEAQKIELFPPNMSDAEYVGLFRHLDFVVLPYSERYEEIGSGILTEALYGSVTPVLLAESRLARFYASLGDPAPCFETLSRASLSDAIEQACARHAHFMANAARVRTRWTAHPQAAEAWARDLSEWIRGG